MNVTSKSRYAFKIMIDLAIKSGDNRAERAQIALAQSIPAHYLDQILLRLKKAGLVVSHRGRSGGSCLSKPATEISVLEIIEAVEDQVAPVQCLISDDLCSLQDSCNSKSGWQLVFGAMRQSVSCISLAELVEAETQSHAALSQASSTTHQKSFTQDFTKDFKGNNLNLKTSKIAPLTKFYTEGNNLP